MTGAAMSAAVANYRSGGREGRLRATDRWRTPLDLYARLNAEFGFVLDAACDSDNLLAPAGLCRDLGRDGLFESWSDAGGPVWCNPPYSHLRPWIEKGGLEGRRVPVVMLVPADTSTRWWRDLVAERASEIRFLVGRPKFRLPDGGEHKTARGGGGLTIPSALVIYRPAGGPPRYGYMDARLRGSLKLPLDKPEPALPRDVIEALS